MALVGRTLTVECPCPGTPHESDAVEYKRVLPLAGGMAAIAAMRDATLGTLGKLDSLRLAEHLFPVYLAHAIDAWTFTGEDGKPLALDAADAALPFETKYLIADAADDLFGEEVTRPLALMIEKGLRAGLTGHSISRRKPSGRSPRSRSGRSSPKSSATETSEPLIA